MIFKKFFVLLFTLAILFSCSSYHAKSLAFKKEVQSGEFEKADELLENISFLKKKRNKLLYYFEKGKTAHLLKNYKQSNDYFNKADYFIEDNKKDFGDAIVSATVNPEMKTYLGEDFEKVAIHYYKALNYIFLNQIDDALVEVKRVNIQLKKINDKYPDDKKNRYATDAFALNLQGILYELMGDINNAFIAYRNAVDLYLQHEGQEYMGVTLPEQLKKDLLSSADSLGFENEKEHYEKKLDYVYKKENFKGGTLVLFWENGAIPYKSQQFFTFVKTASGDGLYNVYNEDLGLNIAVPISSIGDKDEDDSIGDIGILRVAFPMYLSNPAFYEDILVASGEKTYAMERVQDYETIALQTLKDRAFRELGNIIIRVATKKIAEYLLREQNKDLGAILGLINALTEKADTRNWQTLPQNIYYAKIPLQKGANNFEVDFYAGGTSTKKQFAVYGDGTMKIKVLHTPNTKAEVKDY